ncbi:hypothetical protein [Luteimonas sp. FCS-9]|uniref:hypothetical protein n=1 Tax=Luteimonas sp. FCS-9 TaxID=1547516 RepID=UPI00063E766F|nr:hypothetical protein [Luteimonas sp. FCS-9]KLI98713.1 hypothetical protein WQ56_14365 [Luteimonas sp. FCS-9]
MDSFTLEYDMSLRLWVLRQDGSGRLVASFLSRQSATEGSTLRDLIGPSARLRIRNADGSYQDGLADRLAPAMPATGSPAAPTMLAAG